MVIAIFSAFLFFVSFVPPLVIYYELDQILEVNFVELSNKLFLYLILTLVN